MPVKHEVLASFNLSELLAEEIVLAVGSNLGDAWTLFHRWICITHACTNVH